MNTQIQQNLNIKRQWDRDKAFREKNIMGLLGSGFDPGVTNVFIAYAQKHYFDEIEYIDIQIVMMETLIQAVSF